RLGGGVELLDEELGVAGPDATCLGEAAHPVLLPRPVRVGTHGVFDVLVPVGGLVDPTLGDVSGNLEPPCLEYLFPRRSPRLGVGERAVEVEKDSLHGLKGEDSPRVR